MTQKQGPNSSPSWKKLFSLEEAKWQHRRHDDWAEGLAYGAIQDSVHDYARTISGVLSPAVHALVIERNVHDPEIRKSIGQSLYNVWWSAGLLANTYLLDLETAKSVIRDVTPEDSEVVGLKDRVIHLYAEGLFKEFPDVARGVVRDEITDEVVLADIAERADYLLIGN